jgi:hypothetical protein
MLSGAAEYSYSTGASGSRRPPSLLPLISLALLFKRRPIDTWWVTNQRPLLAPGELSPIPTPSTAFQVLDWDGGMERRDGSCGSTDTNLEHSRGPSSPAVTCRGTLPSRVEPPSTSHRPRAALRASRGPAPSATTLRVLIINAITIRALDAKLRLPAYVGLAETQSGEGPVSDDRIVERRTSARSRQLKSGSIIFNENKSVLSCTVRNVSKGGLCLLVPSGLTVPMAFDLSSAGERRHCAVVWRLPDRIGVKYH